MRFYPGGSFDDDELVDITEFNVIEWLLNEVKRFKFNHADEPEESDIPHS